ncbi:MAG: hypothetical protein SFX74_00245 [Fimbriimonadaceae bacterium]|nr:hypothetical protein [Fimbriimonadaceae bacterium]
MTVVGCGGSGGGGGTDQSPQVRSINAVLGVSNLETRINDTLVSSGVPYAAPSNAFVSTPAADADFRIRRAGDPDDLDVLAFVTGQTLSYLVVGIGKLDFGTDVSKRPLLNVINVDRSTPNGTKARIIVINGFLGAPGFDAPTVDFQDGELPQFPIRNLDFREANTRIIDAGSYTFEVRRSESPEMITSQALTFVSGRVYAVLISGEQGNAAAPPTITSIELPVRN